MTKPVFLCQACQYRHEKGAEHHCLRHQPDFPFALVCVHYAPTKEPHDESTQAAE